MPGHIPADIVTATWQRMARMSERQVPLLIDQMRRQQPVVLAYLLAMSEAHFEAAVGQTVFYIGVVIWEIMRQGKRPLRRVTEAQMDRVVEADEKLFEKLMASGEAGLVNFAGALLTRHPEPEVLRYLVEAIVESDDPPFGAQDQGIAFLVLLDVLNALVASRTPRAAG